MESTRENFGVQKYVRIDYHNLDPVELVKLPVSALLGLDSNDADALSNLGIETIQDLALSRLFNFAKAIEEGKADGANIGLGKVAQNAVREGTTISVEELVSKEIDSLSDINSDQADALKDAVAVLTIRDLALWPPFVHAQEILKAAESMSKSQDLDNDGVPDELVPVMRTHATDRLSYKRVYYDHELDSGILSDSVSVDSIPLEELSESPIDLTEKSASTPMSIPAVGTVIRVDQDWFPEGVALGSLSHSLALAPGESTRVAMFDWARQDTAETDDATTQREEVSASRSDKRAINEVQKGTVKEAYNESSRTDYGSNSFQMGFSGSSGAIESFFGGSSGRSESVAESNGFVESVGNSSGNRDVATEMTQDIDQASKQAASSVRSARATIVTEVDQGEQIEARTRMVTNYNHMHALSVHYYEVVQIYRVVTEAKEVRPVIFVPFDALDFRKHGSLLIDRYRRVLMRAALDDYTRGLLKNASAKIIWNIELKSWDHTPSNNSTARREAQSLARFGIEGHKWARRYEVPEDMEIIALQVLGSTDGTVNEIIISIEGARDEIKIPINSGNAHMLDTNIRVGSIDKIIVKGRFHKMRNSELDIARLFIALYLTNGSQNIRLQNVSWVEPSDEIKEVTLLRSDVPALSTDLFEILDQNRLHYSQAIWKSLTPSEIQVAIANRSIAGTRLLQLVEARVLATYGNLVAMPLNIDPLSESEAEIARHLIDWWSNVKDKKSTPRVARIPLGTGGVHAEAILGRANSAEKLDITRFWDWQESPIPLVAPEISPIDLNSRARDVSAQSRGLDPAIVGFQSAPNLPDPAGLQTLSQILTTSGIFSQLSSMASNAALAGQLSEDTSESSQSAAEQATEANRIASQMLTEAIKTAASLYAGSQGFALPGLSSKSSSGKQPRSEQSKTNTGFGARLNEMSKRQSNKNGQSTIGQKNKGSSETGGNLGRSTQPQSENDGGFSSQDHEQDVQMLRTDMGLAPSSSNENSESRTKSGKNKNSQQAVEDSKETSIYIRKLPTVDEEGQSEVLVARIFFRSRKPDPDKLEKDLEHSDRAVLDRLLRDPGFAFQKWRFVGYADARPDSEGDPDFNRNISNWRAIAVLYYLAGQDIHNLHIDPNSTITVGRGAEQSDPEHPENFAFDRRVDVFAQRKNVTTTNREPNLPFTRQQLKQKTVTRLEALDNNPPDDNSDYKMSLKRIIRAYQFSNFAIDLFNQGAVKPGRSHNYGQCLYNLFYSSNNSLTDVESCIRQLEVDSYNIASSSGSDSDFKKLLSTIEHHRYIRSDPYYRSAFLSEAEGKDLTDDGTWFYIEETDYESLPFYPPSWENLPQSRKDKLIEEGLDTDYMSGSQHRSFMRSHINRLKRFENEVYVLLNEDQKNILD